MQHNRPLQDHPEFTIRDYPGIREYRVENWRLARDGSGTILKYDGWSWFDVLVAAIVAFLLPKVRVHLAQGHVADSHQAFPDNDACAPRYLYCITTGLCVHQVHSNPLG